MSESISIEPFATVSYGRCLQSCEHLSSCEAGVFDYSSATCSLYTTASGSCEPCQACEGFERITAGRVTNKALLVSADSVYVEQGAPVPSPEADFSLECWVRIIDGEGSFVGWKDSNSSVIGLQLKYSGEKLHAILHGVALNTGMVLELDTWYHVAATFASSSGELQILVDGVVAVKQQIVSCSGVTWGPSTTLTIGNCNDNIECPVKTFQIAIDEVQSYKLFA